jgi:hypothetical protein
LSDYLTVATLSNLVEELIKTLPAILRSIGDDPEVAAAAAITAWKRAAGDGMRQHTLPITLRENTLVVAVADAVWQKQLGAMTEQLLYKINTVLGQPLVKRIELIVDPEKVMPRLVDTDKSKQQLEVPVEISSAANAIGDKQLRETFVRAASGLLKRRQKEQR